MVTWSRPHQGQVQGASHATTGFVVGLVKRGDLLLAEISIHSAVLLLLLLLIEDQRKQRAVARNIR